MPPDFCNTVSHIFMIPYSALVASRLLGVVHGVRLFVEPRHLFDFPVQPRCLHQFAF